MARMRRACLASAVRAASARNCEILKSWCVISIADMLPAPRINDMLHRVTVAVVWESPQESGSQAAGISGLYLTIFPSGKASWIFRYRFGGRTRKLTIGASPEIGLKDARDLARRAHLRVASGEDP